jgi:hypothetical protein
MRKYDILALCNACGDEHPTELSVFLDSGPLKKQSVADAYRKNNLPPNLATLKDIRISVRKQAGNIRRRITSSFFWFLSASQPCRGAYFAQRLRGLFTSLIEFMVKFTSPEISELGDQMSTRPSNGLAELD